MPESRCPVAVAVILVLAFLMFQHPTFAAGEDVQRFNRIEIWRLRVMWHCTHNDRQVRDHPASDNVEELIQKGNLSGSVDFKLVKSRDSNTKIYQWRTLDEVMPTGQISFSAETTTKSKNKRTGKETWLKMAANATGIGSSGARLSINARSQKFQVGGHASSADGQYEQSASTGPSARSTMGVVLSTGSGQWEGDLPQAGMTITGGTRQVPCNAPLVLAGRPMAVSWTLEPWKEEDLPELWVEPQDEFDNWVPVGNLKDPEQPGNTITVKAWVREPETPKGQPPKKHKARIQFSLPEVSQEPGVCMNWPPASSVKIGDGLRILEEENRGTLEVKASVYAQTPGLVEKTQVVLSVFDYGAWGRLKVTAQDDQGHDLTVRVRGKEGSELKIPVDDNDNHIADAWEKAKGVSGKPADADDETGPEGNHHDGDGLTLYEEYRGFAVKGQHFSSNPLRKDLFICDNTDAKVAGPGIKLFEKASQINVHEVNYKEIGSSSRIINANHAQAPHAVDQHGLLIEDGPKGASPQQVPVSNDAPFGSPKHTLFVQLPVGPKYKSGDPLVDVAHEIGHAVGLQHHGDDALRPVLWTWRSDSDGNWRMYEQNLNLNVNPPAVTGNARPIEVFYEPKEGESTPRPLKHGDGLPVVGFDWSAQHQGWMLQAYTQNGEWAGDVECFMRYQDKQAFLRTPDDGKRYLVDHSQDRARIKFCTSTVANFTNLKAHNPFSRGGEVVLEDRGNCISRIKISDAE